MIEKIIRDYLEAAVDVPTFTEIPENVPSNFLLIEKTGSSVSDHIISSTITVESFAPSLYEAAVLNESVKEKMSLLIADERISRVELNTDYNYTDTETKRYEYQAVFDITHF